MNHPIKIALVSSFDFAVNGGVNDHIKCLAERFLSWGHSVKIIAPTSDPDREEGANFIPMGRPIPLPSGGSVARVSISIWLKPQIKKLIREHCFDIVHLHEPFSGAVTLNMLNHSNSVNVATFHSYEGTQLYRFGGRFAMPYYKKLHGKIAVSEPARDFISRHFPGEYEVIPNGINLDLFSETTTPFSHFRDGMTNLMFLGRLEKRKGLKYLLGAYSKLKWEWPNLRLLIVGHGKPDEDSYRIISERNLTDVEFMGEVSAIDKVRYYRTADIYCSPATGKESFGIVLLEAMAAGKPIVATSIEGYSSVLTHGREGLLVQPKDETALANAINLLLKNPSFGRKLGGNGLATASRYHWEIVATRVIEYYFSRISAVGNSENDN